MEDKFLEVAKQAALVAGGVIKKYSSNIGKKIIKDGDKSDFATKADIEAEEVIIKILTSNFPKHNIIAEESGKKSNDSEYTWVIDPLDGTISFAAGIPTFSVSIGLLRGNKPVLGVINHVSRNDLYWAEISRGAYLNGKKIVVSKTKILKEAQLGLDFGHRRSRQQKFDTYVKPLVNKISYLYSFGSSVTGQALVSAGVLDGYVTQAWIWDFAAGAVIIKEAGGEVTDFSGNQPDWTKDRLSIVASNGLIHDQILEALKA